MRCPNCIIDADSVILITECSGDKQDKHHRISILILLHSLASLSLVLVIKERTIVSLNDHLVLRLLRMVMSL